MKPLLLMGMALALAAPVVAQQRDPGADPKAPSQAQLTSSGSQDIEFVMHAAQGGMAEVEIGKLAADRAKSDEVKKFAQRMVDDHSKGGEQLKSIAQAKGITLPSDLTPKDKALMQRLERLNGTAFDRAYMAAMVRDHQQDVSEFRQESTSGRDPQVKEFAGGLLPTLEDHLKHAKTARTSATASGN
jgi:putative membrane protein